jgi:hypothetical protein
MTDTTDTAITTVQLVVVDMPSRSKGTGCVWVRWGEGKSEAKISSSVGDTYDLRLPVGLQGKAGAKATLRRKTRTEIVRDQVIYEVTGDPADTCILDCCCAQGAVGKLIGARMIAQL